MKTPYSHCRGVLLTAIALAAVAVPLAGCSTTYQASSVKPSGFLKDYSQLRKGVGDEVLMVYLKPGVNWKQYNAILMEPVKVYAAETGWWSKAPPETVQALLNYFDATIRKQLSEDYQFVDAPGPNVLRLRAALTSATGSNVALDTMSSVIPIGIALNLLKQVAYTENMSVGEASIEAELLDSLTGERLIAVVDKRVGRKYTFKFDKFNAWRVAQDSFDTWALRTHNRLAELREGDDIPK